GDVIVTAVSSQGTAKATVHIVDGVMAAGTTLWQSFPDSANNWFTGVAQGRPQHPGDADLFVAEGLETGSGSIRALDHQGGQLWRAFVADWPNSVVGSYDGGVFVQGSGVTKLSHTGEVMWT